MHSNRSIHERRISRRAPGSGLVRGAGLARLCRVRWWGSALLLLVLCAGGLQAQDTTAIRRRSTDTLKARTTPEVRVTASSLPARTTRAALPLAAVTRRQIEAANAVDLGDVVAHVPGAFVKQYGGLGGLRTISMRGTSAQQTVVLLDGVRYRSSASDAFDLGTIPADALEQVEVVRGGDAVLYGANALGGVINIITRAPADTALDVRAHLGAGSFGEARAGVAASGSGGGGSAWQGGVHGMRSDGAYPFTFREFGSESTVHRENADMRELYANAAWTYRGAGMSASAGANGMISERGVPGAVVQGNREGLRARLTERELTANAAVGVDAAGWRLDAVLSGRYGLLRYRDPDARIAGPDGLDNHYDARDAALDLRARRAIAADAVLTANASCSYASLRGDNLDPGVGADVRRMVWSLAARAEWALAPGFLGGETVLDAGVRADLYSDLGAVAVPAVGLVWRVGDLPLRARGHAAMTYRAPSFTEQYYLNFGNRDLRPERGEGYDVGLTYELDDAVALEANLFLLNVRDQIVSVPRSPVSWSARNVASVLTRGFELSAAGALFDDAVGVRLSYTRQRAEDRSGAAADGKLLPYAPEELFNGAVEARLAAFNLGVTWQYASHRFSGPTNEYSSMLPRYAVVGVNATATWGALALRAECANLLDHEYQVVAGFPMPGRSFRLMLTMRYR